jgi:RING finger protein 113A
MAENAGSPEKIKEDVPKCTFVFKKSLQRPAGGRGRQQRQRNAHESESDSDLSSDDGDTKIERLQRKRKSNPLVQSTTTFAGVKRRVDGLAEESDSEDDSSSIGVVYKSNREARLGPQDMGATATIEVDTEIDRDARAIADKALKLNQETKGLEVDNVYRGINNYKKYVLPKESAAGSSTHSSENAKGPVRAPSNIRSTVRWDYKPDLCKDYKETGFCGFGDSCIFLHDRTDYKSGWQIELQYANGEYDKDDKDASKYEIPEEDGIPFKCLICRNSFENPVVTKCKHYFCEKCALDHHRKSKRCAVCSAPTQGIFNPAKEIARRLKLRQIEKEERSQFRDEEDDEDHSCHHDHEDAEEEDHD